MEEMLNLLQAPELKQLCKQMNLPHSASSSKNHCIGSLLSHCKQHKPLLSHLSPVDALMKKYVWLSLQMGIKIMLYRARRLLGSCVCVSSSCIETFSRIMLMFTLTSTGGMSSDDDNTPSGIMWVYHYYCCFYN